ncbi:DUF3124 domain-containing protein [Carboxylicivirga sp. RSCT41]|uniref:DUF3124 domain-containing protein n=1 Tax=Carboxylicivirga agarovorans TaxID=3417570 RepID=UPI003D34D25E
MRYTFTLIIIVFTVLGCNSDKAGRYPIKQADWKSKQVNIENYADYYKGKTYLPVYSHIYHIHGERTFDLTITVSLRNISSRDSVFILKADYFNTLGENVRQYIEKPIYLNPLETMEIVIKEQDIEGGSGANFVFDWACKNGKNPPLFEAVMISTYGQQGISFTTRGIQITE